MKKCKVDFVSSKDATKEQQSKYRIQPKMSNQHDGQHNALGREQIVTNNNNANWKFEENIKVDFVAD